MTGSSSSMSFNTKILIILVLLITYGSLYPGNFTTIDSDALQHFFKHPSWTTSIGDILGNIILFFPLGIVGARIIHPRNKLSGLLLLCITSFFFSLLLQILQIGLPTRSAALADVFWNMLGLLLGIGTSTLAKQISLSWANKLPLHNNKPFVPLIILCFWLASELLPLVPSLDLQKFKDAIKPLQTPDFHFSWIWLHTAGIVTAGCLLSTLLVTRSFLWLTWIFFFVLLGKITIINQFLDASTLAGLSIGYFLSIPLLKTRLSIRANITFWTLLIAWTVHALTPFSFAAGGTFNLIPFTNMLEGSMLTNATALILSLYIYSALLWLTPYIGGNFRGVALALLFWSTIIELIQMGLLGRNADITEPLLVGLVVWGLSEARKPAHHTEVLHHTTTNNSTYTKPAATPSTNSLPTQTSPLHSSPFKKWIPLILLTTGTTGLFWFILQLPQIPYNLKELFLFNGHIFSIFIFVLALLWIGTSAAWLSTKILTSTKLFIKIPGWLLIASLISLGLLSSSVTQESITDITGSNNLYWFVTNKDSWGEGWRHIFEWLGPISISAVERLVRYTALYSPIIIFLALIISFFNLHNQHKLTLPKMGILIISAFPWLWLAKGIAFDWSSTDNLNELIALQGAMGMGGGFYLYILLFILCTNAVILTNLSGRIGEWIIGIILSLILLPIGWLLLSLGLESEVHKYGQVFSGTQFLLGPDREHTLSDIELFIRWCLIQIGFIVITSSGIRCFYRISR